MRFTVAVNGQVLSVDSVTLPAGGTPTVYSDAALSSAVTFPNVIAADTTYYLRESQAFVTVKQTDGSTLLAVTVVDLETISPRPSADQLAADAVSGGHSLWFPASALSSTSGSPTFIGAGSGAGQRFPHWLLDASTAEQVTATFQVPAHWGSFNLDLYWCNAGAGSGDVQWRPTHSVRADGADLSSGDVTGADIAITAAAQSILKVTRLMTAVTRADGLYHCRVMRRADQAGDTLANDASVLGLLLGKA